MTTSSKGNQSGQQPGQKQQAQDASTPQRQQQQSGEGQRNESQEYGEGNYKAARQYNEDLKEHVQHHDIEKEARDAAPKSADEEREMEEAERIARSRARGEKKSPDAPEDEQN